MLIELPNLWIVLLNMASIPVIHLAVSWWFTRLPGRLFDPRSSLFRERAWENGGKIYPQYFRIRRWKGMLPDAAPWFRGFPKKNLRSKDPEYLRAFIIETCRGEAAHLAQIPTLLITMVWNPWPTAAVVMIIYAFLSNLPCILLQRHNRVRLCHLAGDLETLPSKNAANA